MNHDREAGTARRGAAFAPMRRRDRDAGIIAAGTPDGRFRTLADDILRVLGRGPPRGIGRIGAQLTYASRMEIAAALGDLEKRGDVQRVRGRLFTAAVERARTSTKDRVLQAFEAGRLYRVQTVAEGLGESTALVWYHIWDLLGAEQLASERIGKRRYVWLTRAGERAQLESFGDAGPDPSVHRATPTDLDREMSEPRIAFLLALRTMKSASAGDIEKFVRSTFGLRMRGINQLALDMASSGLLQTGVDGQADHYKLTRQGEQLLRLLAGHDPEEQD